MASVFTECFLIVLQLDWNGLGDHRKHCVNKLMGEQDYGESQS